MANAYIQSTLPTTYASFWSQGAGMLLSAGWTHQASGDGVSVYNTTPGSTTGAFAGGVNNSWIRLQDPGGVREYIFQCNATTGFRWKYSVSAKFTGGSPAFGTCPTSTDQVFAHGAGAETNGTYTATLPSFTSGTTRIHGKANGTAPYGWWIGASAVAGAPSLMMVFDPVTGASADNDQTVHHCRSSGWTGSVLNSLSDTIGTVDNAYAFWNPACTTWLGCPAAGYYLNSTIQFGTNGAVNPFDSTKHELLPIRYGRNSAATTIQGDKGWSTMLRWTATALTNVVTATADLNWIVYGSLWVPWDGATTPVD